MDLTHAYKITQLAGFGELSNLDAGLFANRICTDLLLSRLALPPMKVLALMSPEELEHLRKRVSQHPSVPHQRILIHRYDGTEAPFAEVCKLADIQTPEKHNN